MNTNTEHTLKVAAANLTLTQPFFATLLYQLERIEDNSIGTMATDGRVIRYNTKFTDSLPINHVIGVLGHEVLHCALAHPWRRMDRDGKKWNYACDYVINLLLKAEGFDLPADALLDQKYIGMSADAIYEILPDDFAEQAAAKGQGLIGEMGMGEILDPQPGEDVKGLDVEWQTNVIQAATAARAQGKVPAFVKRLVDDIRKPKVDWIAELKRFVQELAKNDYSWKMPNTRYISSGLYLPSIRSQQMPPVVIYWDTSGSRDSAHARIQCASEAASVIEEVQPDVTYVIYADAKVQRVDEFKPYEPIKFNPIGGGGTDFRPVFDWVSQRGIEPACFIGITDLLGTFPRVPPEYPVLWACTEEGQRAPFGETLYIGA